MWQKRDCSLLLGGSSFFLPDGISIYGLNRLLLQSAVLTISAAKPIPSFRASSVRIACVEVMRKTDEKPPRRLSLECIDLEGVNGAWTEVDDSSPLSFFVY